VSDIQTKAAEIKNTGIARVLVDYLELKLNNTKTALISVDIKDAQKLQGRAVELTELIKFFKSEK
jgi:hypothetical protein